MNSYATACARVGQCIARVDWNNVGQYTALSIRAMSLYDMWIRALSCDTPYNIAVRRVMM